MAVAAFCILPHPHPPSNRGALQAWVSRPALSTSFPPFGPGPSGHPLCFLSRLPPASHTEAWIRKVQTQRALVLLSFPPCIAAYVNRATEICIGWCSQKPGKPSARNVIGYAFSELRHSGVSTLTGWIGLLSRGRG